MPTPRDFRSSSTLTTLTFRENVASPCFHRNRPAANAACGCGWFRTGSGNTIGATACAAAPAATARTTMSSSPAKRASRRSTSAAVGLVHKGRATVPSPASSQRSGEVAAICTDINEEAPDRFAATTSSRSRPTDSSSRPASVRPGKRGLVVECRSHCFPTGDAPHFRQRLFRKLRQERRAALGAAGVARATAPWIAAGALRRGAPRRVPAPDGAPSRSRRRPRRVRGEYAASARAGGPVGGGKRRASGCRRRGPA